MLSEVPIRHFSAIGDAVITTTGNLTMLEPVATMALGVFGLERILKQMMCIRNIGSEMYSLISAIFCS